MIKFTFSFLFLWISIVSTLAKESSLFQNVLVTLKDPPTDPRSKVLESLAMQRDLVDRTEQKMMVAKALKEHSTRSQSGVLSFLNSQKAGNSSQIEVVPLWVVNGIIVNKADMSLIQSLMNFDQVKSVEPETMIKLDDPKPKPDEKEETMDGLGVSGKQANNREAQWNVKAVQAPEMWSKGIEGQGVVVAVIDTGVRESHEALKGNYANNGFSWFDPSGGSTSPVDPQGHGTHCAGTILGTTKGIGVAPKAKWIACRGCSSSSCSSNDLIRCGQFVACPTDPSGKTEDCSKAPDVVSNSWGGNGGGFKSYKEVVKTWHAANIIPVFAIGNSGPLCGTAGAPGDFENVIAVGATTKLNQVASFSSLGPSVGGLTKPDISAPGDNIYSASHKNDRQYTTMSGTSMATPATAGVVALMISAQKSQGRSVTFAQIRDSIKKGGVPVTASVRNILIRCGTASQSTYPNNYSGMGRINATQAILAMNS